MQLTNCTCVVMIALLMVGYTTMVLAIVHAVIIGDLHLLWCTTNELELCMQGGFLFRYIRISDFSLPVWTLLLV